MATAAGKILYFDPGVSTPQGTIGFSSSSLSMTSDGSTLGASANTMDSQYEPDRTLNIYSLSSGTITASFPYQFNNPDLLAFSLAGTGSSTVLEQTVQTNTSGCTQQIAAISGTPVIWNVPCMYGSVELSPDGTLIAATQGSPSTASASSTNIFKNGQLVIAIPGLAIGWIDNDSLLVNNYVYQGSPTIDPGYYYSGASIYNASGVQQSTPPLPELKEIQSINASEVYSADKNTIYSLSDGSIEWSTSNPSTGVGAVAGPYVVFASGAQILVDTY